MSVDILGLDLGNSALKIDGPGGTIYVPSLTATANSQRLTTVLGVKTNVVPLLIQTEAVDFYVGSRSYQFGQLVENYDYQRLNGSPEVRALFYAGLTRYSEKYGLPAELRLVVGLPYEVLSVKESQVNAENVRRWLKGHHCWRANGKLYEVNIVEARITLQSVGAVYDYLVDDHGQPVEDRKAMFAKELGAISLGFGTIELLTLQNMKVNPEMSTGKMAGMRRLVEMVNQDSLYSLGELDELLREGHVRARSQLDIYESSVVGQIEKVWSRNWRRFSMIIIAGGGAKMVGDRLKIRFEGKAFIADDPVAAIAKGLRKLGLQSERGK